MSEWIEIPFEFFRKKKYNVSLYMSECIEIFNFDKSFALRNVSLYMSEWIEMTGSSIM